jgi:hypothetical protein
MFKFDRLSLAMPLSCWVHDPPLDPLICWICEPLAVSLWSESGVVWGWTDFPYVLLNVLAIGKQVCNLFCL